jgi:signal transduction histidine kinase/putative methionine-R-sulfoxide reductase with GAF domain
MLTKCPPPNIEQLTAALEEMTAAKTVDELLALLLDRSLALTGTSNGWMSLYHPESQRLRIMQQRGDPYDCRGDEASMELGEGVTGTALKERRLIRINDVREGEYAKVYKMCWRSTLSELAVPLYCRAARLEGHRTIPDAKLVGVLNLEKGVPSGFSHTDEEILRSLAHHASVLIERLEVTDKRRKVDEIEKQVLGKSDRGSTIQTIVNEIKNTLGYSYVNIWLVREDEQAIRCEAEYAIGVTELERAELRKKVIPMGDEDIRADIVRTRAVEVPPPDDPRLDADPFEKARNEQFVRVFLPLIASGNRVLGTVEAGHLRSNRPCIYEHDVRILEDFVGYAAVALEQWRLGLMDRISHDFRSPIAAIMADADMIVGYHGRLGAKGIIEKGENILMYCEALRHQVDEFEYLLARPLRRDLTDKVKSQDLVEVIYEKMAILMPAFKEAGLVGQREPCITVNIYKRVIPSADWDTLNHVFYNLLTNSIKYAKKDRTTFRLEIDQTEMVDYYVIRFKDWGMGVPNGLEEKIFEHGVRAPEAIDRDINSSGLGLTIARNAVRAIGGDLRLVNNCEPTEFHILLPKNARRRRDDDDLVRR